MRNCIAYSIKPEAQIIFNGSTSGEIKISFINQGNPIKPEEEENLFDHFYKGSNSKGLTGFGLGLVLTKKIVELHHGSISYFNPSGNTIVFDVRLPLR